MDHIRIHPDDNVAVALKPLAKGMSVCGVTLCDDIPPGHKFALTGIAKNENILKYGAPIGHATETVAPGAWVHTHNTKTNLSDVLDYTYCPVHPSLPSQPPRTFRGYRRPDGRVGIRNEIWIIPTVGCVNSPAQALAKEAASFVHGTVDGVYAFPHP